MVLPTRAWIHHCKWIAGFHFLLAFPSLRDRDWIRLGDPPIYLGEGYSEPPGDLGRSDLSRWAIELRGSPTLSLCAVNTVCFLLPSIENSSKILARDAEFQIDGLCRRLFPIFQSRLWVLFQFTQSKYTVNHICKYLKFSWTTARYIQAFKLEYFRRKIISSKIFFVIQEQDVCECFLILVFVVLNWPKKKPKKTTLQDCAFIPLFKNMYSAATALNVLKCGFF